MVVKWLKGLFGFDQTKIIAYFIDETKSIYRTRQPYSNNCFTVTIGGSKQTYIVDPDSVLYSPKEKHPVCFYYVNNPLPLDIKHTLEYGDKSVKAIVDAQGLNSIIKNTGVKELFSSGMGDGNLVLYIVIINMVLTMFLGFGVYVIWKGVSGA